MRTPILNTSPGVGANVKWVNENGIIEGTFRGFTGPNLELVVLVASGSQMIAPAKEVFTASVLYPIDSLHAVCCLSLISPFLSPFQRQRIAYQFGTDEKGEYAKARVLSLRQTIDAMPKANEQDAKGMEAIANLHYSRGPSNYYITAKDIQGTGADQAFGLVTHSGGNSELRHINIRELAKYHGAELNIDWAPKTLSLCI